MARLKRHENDIYHTPKVLVDGLLTIVDINGSVLEPCCGEGHLVAPLEDWLNIKQVTAIDIDRSKGENTILGVSRDATNSAFWDFFGGHDWVITNPPFNQAEKILPLAFKHSNIGVAFLLRLSYLEPCKNRRQWLIDQADRMRYLIPVNPRPKFRTDTKNTDSVTCAWFVWLKHWSWEEQGIDCPFEFLAF